MGRRTDGVEFRLLGPFEALVGGRRVPLGGSRQEKLLAALLLRPGRLVTAARLVDALWDEDPPDTARKQVHNAIAAARRRLGAFRDLLITDGTGYRIDATADQVDAHRFRLAVATAEDQVGRGEPGLAVATLSEALLLWRGPALDGLTGRALEAEAAALEEQRLAAHETLIGLRLDLGDTSTLVPELVHLVQEHPLRERLRHHLVLALYRAGRQPEALLAYERTRAALAAELGVDPGPELRELHRRMLRDEPAPPPVTPREPPAASLSQLPHDIADFTGRAAELDRVLGLVSPTDGTAVVITTLDGMAGVGKTTLAVRAAHLLRTAFPDGQVFIDLHGHTPGQEPLTATAALDRLLRGVGVPPEQVPDGVTERSSRWRSELAGKRVLVLLDNVADGGQLRPLLPGGATAGVLATSRRRLSDLDGTVSFSLDVMDRDDGIALFRAVVGDERVLAEPAATAEVVAHCGLLPLAIRIAASRLRHRPTWTVAHLADRLRDERRRLTELAVGDRSVPAAFNVSYHHLDARQQRAFRLLGLHPGPLFDLHAAAALLDVPPDEAEMLLEGLLDVHLLIGHAIDRYRFHDLLRHHAHSLAGRLESAADREAALRRLGEHLVDLGTAVERVIDPGRDLKVPAPRRRSSLPPLRTATDARRVVAAVQPNFQPTIRAALDHGLHDLVWRLAVVFGTGLMRQGYVEDALSGYEHALDAARRVDDLDALAVVYRDLGVAHLGAGRFAAAHRTFELGLAIEEARGDRRGAGRMLSNLGIACIRSGRYDEAVTALCRALELAEGFGTPRDLAAVLSNLGVAHAKTGRYDEAAHHHRRALAINTELDNPYMIASSLLNLGWVHTRSGDLVVALDHLRRALSLGGRIGDREIEARGLHFLSDCLRRLGKLEDALDAGRSALVLAREIGSPDVEGQALCALGEVHYDLGAPDAAGECFARVVGLGDQDVKSALAHDGLARIAALRGDHAVALDHWEKALAIATRACLPETADIRRRLAEVSGRA